MMLEAGTKLGLYHIVSPLGEGGMGEVYRARDTKLNRDVALKVLPEVLAQDPERMARFKREAQVLASLNHPNIATIYGYEESDGIRALAMELVEGQTLAEVVGARQGVPLPEALPIAKQIADALEYAHERGIIHRDLKPANVKVTPDGIVKVLDFGLAKALDADPSSSSSNVSNSPTLTLAATQAGVIIGTAAYMSPEQARGKSADRRADVWAFGCVLYEMLAGRRLFEAETVSDTLAAVLTKEPDWDALPGETPLRIREIVRRCLLKDRRQRLQAIGEARIAIEDVMSGDVGASQGLAPGEAAPRPYAALRRALPWVAGIVIGALIAGLAVWNAGNRQAPALSSTISQIQPPPDSSLDLFLATYSPPQLSPDGKSIAYTGKSPSGKGILYVRSLDSLSAKRLNGTESATHPFWSPDGHFIGFFADGKLRKVDISGGPPVDICAASLGWGGSWGPDGTIVLVPSGASPIFRVPAGGGQPVQVTSLDSSRKEAGESFPQFLPDGRHFLFYSESASPEFSGIYAGSLDGGDPKLILRGVSIAKYTSPGYLLYLQDGALTARNFNLDKLEVSGDPVIVQRPSGGEQIITLSVSPNGNVVYVEGTINHPMQMAWFDRSGTKEGDLGGPGEYYTPRLSPDDRKVAVAVAPDAPTRDLWIYDLTRLTQRRLSFDSLHNWTPVWSPDGTQIAYDSNPKGNFHIYARPADGSGSVHPLLEDDGNEYVNSWSPDGKYLAYSRSDPGGKPGWDIWVLPVRGGEKPYAVVQSPANKFKPTFSPDGKWLAYESDESGTWQIFVVPFPRGEGKWQISTGGGRQPSWRGDGKEIYFMSPDLKLMAVEVSEKGPSLEVGSVRELFQTHSAPVPFRTYDVTRDGKKFLVISQNLETGSKPITLITNWPALLDKK